MHVSGRQQAIVSQSFDRIEILKCKEVRTGWRGDLVVRAVWTPEDYGPVPGGHVRRRAVQCAPIEKDDRAGWTFRRNQPVSLDQLVYRLVAIGTADRVFGETPVFRNAIKVSVGRDHAEFVGPENEYGRPVEFCYASRNRAAIMTCGSGMPSSSNQVR